MESFEGYVGIRLWSGQLVDDVVFSSLLVIIMLFSVMFRYYSPLFVKMLKDTVSPKERNDLFISFNKSDVPFRLFMAFQTLFIITLCFYASVRSRGLLDAWSNQQTLIFIASVFLLFLLFYFFKQFLYYLLGSIFVNYEKFCLWETSYSATFGVCGLTLYLPVIWLIFIGSYAIIPLFLSIFLYILWRFVIIYKTISIFRLKSVGLFYLSLYLCAQEIIPLVFLYEGMISLYNFIETSTLWH